MAGEQIPEAWVGGQVTLTHWNGDTSSSARCTLEGVNDRGIVIATDEPEIEECSTGVLARAPLRPGALLARIPCRIDANTHARGGCEIERDKLRSEFDARAAQESISDQRRHAPRSIAIGSPA